MTWLARIGAALAVCVALAGCAVEEVWAPEEAVRAAAFVPGGEPRVTLITMINNRTGAGGHSALMIDGAQRVLFDPAGSWHHPQVPERNDVLYGMNPTLLDYYYDYHARETYHLLIQEITVSPDIAAFLTQQVESYGPVPQAQCALSISSVLSRTPGFESISRGWFPTDASEQMSAIPGVQSRQIFDDDSDDNLELLQAQARAAQSREAIEALAAE
jgi:hypothetical protein